MLDHFYQYRRYIWRNARNELRYRYAGASLGIFWHLIHPLLQVLIYTFVFTQVVIIRPEVQQDAPFVLYLCAGLFPWLAFSETLLQGSNAFLENAVYLKRLPIPAEVFLAKNVLVSTFSFCILLLLLIPFSLLLGEPLSWSLLILPIVALLLQALALGLALSLANLRVFFPDIGEVLRAVLQLWQWTMPIVYPAALLPESIQPWLIFNPPYVFIQSIRLLFLEQKVPGWPAWGMMLGWVLLFTGIGALILRKLQVEVRDSL